MVEMNGGMTTTILSGLDKNVSGTLIEGHNEKVNYKNDANIVISMEVQATQFHFKL